MNIPYCSRFIARRLKKNGTIIRQTYLTNELPASRHRYYWIAYWAGCGYMRLLYIIQVVRERTLGLEFAATWHFPTFDFKWFPDVEKPFEIWRRSKLLQHRVLASVLHLWQSLTVFTIWRQFVECQDVKRSTCSLKVAWRLTISTSISNRWVQNCPSHCDLPTTRGCPQSQTKCNGW